MSHIVYNKDDGDILMLKRGLSSSFVFESSLCKLFPTKDVGVWYTNKKISNIKNCKLILDESREPIGLSIYGEDEYFNKKFPNVKKEDACKINYKGVFFDHGGYANMNRELAFELNNYDDIDLKVEIIASAKQIDNKTHGRLLHISADGRKDNLFNIIGFTPMSTNPFGYNIFYTMMETETLSPMFADTCNRYADAIFTPTNWNKKVFEKGGIKKPIHVVPLGINPELYHTNVRKASITCKELPSGKMVTKLPKFNFITLFGWSYRKGIDVLLNAYFDKFKNNEDVGLIICSRYNGGSDSASKMKVERDIMNFMKNHHNPGKVYYYGESTSIDKMPSVLANGDCFVWGSRGEGFGLPVLESGALGMPVVSTFNSGMTEYLDDSNSYLVHTDEFVVADRNLTCISPYYNGQLFPNLGSSCVNDFGIKMRHVYENYSEAMIKSDKFVKDINEKYTWEKCASRIYEILNGIKGDLGV
jgi:glycosyltransferase involved in cell wall biosynthesis